MIVSAMRNLLGRPAPVLLDPHARFRLQQRGIGLEDVREVLARPEITLPAPGRPESRRVVAHIRGTPLLVQYAEIGGGVLVLTAYWWGKWNG